MIDINNKERIADIEKYGSAFDNLGIQIYF
jgi:hypothetical protein